MHQVVVAQLWMVWIWLRLFSGDIFPTLIDTQWHSFLAASLLRINKLCDYSISSHTKAVHEHFLTDCNLLCALWKSIGQWMLPLMGFWIPWPPEPLCHTKQSTLWFAKLYTVWLQMLCFYCATDIKRSSKQKQSRVQKNFSQNEIMHKQQ